MELSDRIKLAAAVVVASEMEKSAGVLREKPIGTTAGVTDSVMDTNKKKKNEIMFFEPRMILETLRKKMKSFINVEKKGDGYQLMPLTDYLSDRYPRNDTKKVASPIKKILLGGIGSAIGAGIGAASQTDEKLKAALIGAGIGGALVSGSSLLQNIGRAKEIRMLQTVPRGMVTGGAIGSLIGATSGDKRNRGRRALTGLAIGAGAGGLGKVIYGLARPAIVKRIEDLIAMGKL